MTLSIHGNHWIIFLMSKRQSPISSLLTPTPCVISIWPIWILSISFINMIHLPFMIVTMPFSITWKLIFKMGVVLQMLSFFPILPDFSCSPTCTYALYKLSCFIHAAIILLHRHSLIFPFTWLTGTFPWSRFLYRFLFPWFIFILCKAVLNLCMLLLHVLTIPQPLSFLSCVHSWGYLHHIFNHYYNSP